MTVSVFSKLGLFPHVLIGTPELSDLDNLL